MLKENVKAGLGISGLMVLGAGIGIGAKALGGKIVDKVKEKKNKKAEASEEEAK